MPETQIELLFNISELALFDKSLHAEQHKSDCQTLQHIELASASAKCMQFQLHALNTSHCRQVNGTTRRKHTTKDPNINGLDWQAGGFIMTGVLVAFFLCTEHCTNNERWFDVTQ